MVKVGFIQWMRPYKGGCEKKRKINEGAKNSHEEFLNRLSAFGRLSPVKKVKVKQRPEKPTRGLADRANPYRPAKHRSRGWQTSD